MIDALDTKPCCLKGSSERLSSEIRAMLVKKVPDHLVTQNPIDARGFKEDPCVRSVGECLADGLKQMDGGWNMFYDMPAYDDIGWNVGAIRAIVTAFKPDSPVE